MSEIELHIGLKLLSLVKLNLRFQSLLGGLFSGMSFFFVFVFVLYG